MSVALSNLTEKKSVFCRADGKDEQLFLGWGEGKHCIFNGTENKFHLGLIKLHLLSMYSINLMEKS